VTLDEFLAEANRLAKPCYYYQFAHAGQPITGYWHGVKAGELCISIKHKGNWLNVYLDENYSSGRVELSIQPNPSNSPLYRSDAISLPPIDAVFRFGSNEIEKYLKNHGWQRDWGFNNNFKGAVAHEYQKEWFKNCPLYTGGVVAVEGGWNIPWPEGDWESLLGLDLLLWTFEESEPWVEVFTNGSLFSVFQRIT
jgi:hypothetical protein